ncbi:hypothetical protein [Burkholderia gladioli]|uniref:hypothetical protein n=1 Tax=Burkholderia gladioli TaxID=28095 RepID=UPI001C217569|nr:hypothetical protein [Burkholderia gladioli]MBU9645306.1 hypothetical protein [Burkholderia gladioli]
MNVDLSFGAVVSDLDDEAHCLETIAVRNRRHAINPLSESYLEDLLAPLDTYEVILRRPEWRRIALSLAHFIETALAHHWEIDGACRRNVYCWRRAEVVERWDYPAWAQRAATILMRQAYSILKRGDEADADDGDLLNAARHYIGYTGLLTDAQILSGLAVHQATIAIECLIESANAVENDTSLVRRLRRLREPDIQADEIGRSMFDDEVELALDRAALRCFYPSLADATEYRVHAEKLLLLADVSALGRLSPRETSQLVASVASERAAVSRLNGEISERRQRLQGNAAKATEATRVLTDELAAHIRAEYQTRRDAEPIAKVEVIEAELAAKYGVSRSTIQRARGVRKKRKSRST